MVSHTLHDRRVESLESLMSTPFPQDLIPEVPHNSVIRPSYIAIMVLTWVIFGVFGCLGVPMLALWMSLGIFTVII